MMSTLSTKKVELNKVVHCANSKCRTTTTPLWRKGWPLTSGKHARLCNACGLHFKKDHFCPYCYQIYRESEGNDANNPWLVCHRCSRWVHQKCEQKHGHHFNINNNNNNNYDNNHSEKNNNNNNNNSDNNSSFLCPDCHTLKQTNPNEFEAPVTRIITPKKSISHSRTSTSTSTSTSSSPISSYKITKQRRSSPKKTKVLSASNQIGSLLQRQVLHHNKPVNNIISSPEPGQVTLPSFDNLTAELPQSNNSSAFKLDFDHGFQLLLPYKTMS